MKKDILLELLRRMKLIRMTEEAIAARYSGNTMRCPTHLCSGQEAVAAAVGVCLRSDDLAVSSHRAHGHYLGKGGDLKAMLAEVYGKAAGCCGGKGGSMHLIDLKAGFVGSTAIVGGTIPVGVGLGLAMKLRREQRVSVVFLGDGAVEEGVFYESVNFAVLKNIPVLFICENNLYSVYSPLWVRQPKGRRIHEMVRGMGCFSDAGDGNDVLEVYRKVRSAAERVRCGAGPVFFEFATYRWREHCGPNFDNDIGYRTEQEYLRWRKKDPVVCFERTLLREKTLTREALRGMEEQIKADIEAAFDFAEASPFPDAQAAYTQVYRDGTP